MKNVAIIVLLTCSIAYGQTNTFPSSGNVGIGTTAPGAKLSFNNVDGTNLPDGITWYNPTPLVYGIYRTAGSWVAPNYQQLKLSFETGIILDPGSLYGKSYVDIQGAGLRVSSGNVGIGTTTPSYKLQVVGGAIAMDDDQPLRGGGKWLISGNAGAVTVGTANPSVNLRLFAGDVNPRVFVDGTSGNVGIGTTTPGYKLDVNGGGRFNTNLDIGGARNPGSAPGALNIFDFTVGDYTNFQFAQSAWGGSHAILFNAYKSNPQVNGDLMAIGNIKHANDVGPYQAGSGMIHYLGNGGRMDFYLSQNSSGKDTNVAWPTPVLSLTRGGTVGIGVLDPGTFKLAVNGKIWGTEVQVALSKPGPDYVFEKSYDLRPLEEVKTYIDKNKHLPEIPSAREMQANGINLGEMNMLLLRKIEELTLYVIEQNKQIAKLQERSVSSDLSGKRIEELTLYVIELKKRDEEQQKEIEELKTKK